MRIFIFFSVLKSALLSSSIKLVPSINNSNNNGTVFVPGFNCT